MLAFADTVLEEFIKPVYGVVFLAAALAIVFADALRRVQGWGPVWTGPGSRARLSATASRGARRVAVAAVGTAMIVPFIVPGFGSKAIFDISSTNASDRVRIDPLVSIKASLTRSDPVEVFQVRADAPSYWRMVSLTDFDGDTWRPDLIDTGDPVSPDTILSSGTVGAEPVQQTFTISSDLGFPGCRSPTRRNRSTFRARRCATTAPPERPRSTVSSTPAPNITSRRSPCNRPRRSWRR